MGSFTFSNTYTQATDNGSVPAAGIGLNYAAFQLGLPTSMSVDNNTSVTEGNPYLGWYGMDTARDPQRHVDAGITHGIEVGPTKQTIARLAVLTRRRNCRYQCSGGCLRR